MSTAYYALFHVLALSAARSMVPKGARDEVYGLARHVSHASIRQVASYVGGARPPRYLDAVIDRLRRNPSVSQVSTAFVVLQEKREQADYDHGADFTRSRALDLVERSASAVVLVERRAGTDDFQAFLGLITLRTSVR